jgi:hypothetical protein
MRLKFYVCSSSLHNEHFRERLSYFTAMPELFYLRLLLLFVLMVIFLILALRFSFFLPSVIFLSISKSPGRKGTPGVCLKAVGLNSDSVS